MQCCCFSPVQLLETLWTVAHQAPVSLGFSSKTTGVGCHALLQGTFQIQGSDLHLLCLQHCRNHSGSHFSDYSLDLSFQMFPF